MARSTSTYPGDPTAAAVSESERRAPIERAPSPTGAITAAQARLALDDAEVRSLARLRRVDLDAVVRNLRLDPERRLLASPLVATDDFHRILETLRAHSVRFVIIGGLAARLHGSTYGTADFDICHARDGANLRALAAMLRELDAVYRRLPLHGPPELDARIFATETDFVFCTRHGKFDLIGEFTGVGRYPEASADSPLLHVDGGPVRALSLRKLTASKRSTGRAKDQLVADELEVIAAIRARVARR